MVLSGHPRPFVPQTFNVFLETSRDVAGWTHDSAVLIRLPPPLPPLSLSCRGHEETSACLRVPEQNEPSQGPRGEANKLVQMTRTKGAVQFHASPLLGIIRTRVDSQEAMLS
jgi:hypothetical protein